MENQQLQQPAAIDTRVSGNVKTKKKREFKNRKTFSLLNFFKYSFVLSSFVDIFTTLPFINFMQKLN